MFDNLRDVLSFNLRAVLPLLFIVAAVLGNVVVVARLILPNWSAYQHTGEKIDSYKAELQARQTEAANEDNLTILGLQVEGRRTDRDAAAAIFLTGDQANQLLDQLFGYAVETGVEVTSLQAQQAMQATDSGSYDVRLFRLQIEGEVHLLLDFVTHFREAAALGVTMRSVQIKADKSRTALTTEILLYTSPFASGDALNDLPQVTIQPPVAAPTTQPEPPVEDAATSTAEPELRVTPLTYLAAPVQLNLLYTDSFDSGAMYVWDVGPAWTFVPRGDGQALNVTGSNDPVTFRHRTLQNAAVQIRVKVEGGSARLSLRESGAGSYTGVISPESGEVRLYRGDVMVRSVPLAASSQDGWYTLQLSAIDDIVRLVVDGVEYVAIRDLAPLPPGTTSFALRGGGTLLVDDFMLWTLPASASDSN